MSVVSIPGQRRAEHLAVNLGSAYDAMQFPSAASTIELEEMSPQVDLQDVLQSEVKYVILFSSNDLQ